MTQEEVKAAIEDIKLLAELAKIHFAHGDAANPGPETRFEIYKDIAKTDAQIEELIADASKGSAFAASVLSYVACARFLDAAAPLDRWILSVLRERATKQKGSKGRRRSSPEWNSFISYAVSRVHERYPALKLTKGRDSKTEVSVCSIVSEGLSRAGRPLGETRVAEIFNEQQNLATLPKVLDL